ncbi:MAG: hypothetical protein KDC98_10950 [Planctomycetes bacterium]|nr:hypothetical protein [Planctomycetota bacterium]
MSLLAGGCSVADNLSYGEIARELDAIVVRRGRGQDLAIEYADRAPVSAWYMRSYVLTYLIPIRPLLGVLLGPTEIQDLESPSRHVRELMRQLPIEVGDDLALASDCMARLAQIAELDPSPGSRVVALDGACDVLAQLGITGLGAPVEQASMTLEPQIQDAALKVFGDGRPAARQAAQWDDSARTAYRTAVERLTERPLDHWQNRIALIGDLLQSWQQEPESELRQFTADALRRAVGHAARGALIRAVQGRDPRYGPVRLCAMQQLRRLGGVEAVAFLLAIMAEPAAGAASIVERFDQDPLVQLRLIHLCGQLRGEAAKRAVHLSGREEWDAITPVTFLAQTVLTEQDYYSKLRVPALTALCLCLEKPRLDYDVAWVENMYRKL